MKCVAVVGFGCGDAAKKHVADETVVGKGKRTLEGRRKVQHEEKNMNLSEDAEPADPIRRKTSRVPSVAELVHVRSRRWFVEEIIEPKSPGQTCVVRLSCADDDAQGQSLEVFWDYELDRLFLKGSAHETDNIPLTEYCRYSEFRNILSSRFASLPGADEIESAELLNSEYSCQSICQRK
jgi:hypothetical protein